MGSSLPRRNPLRPLTHGRRLLTPPLISPPCLDRSLAEDTILPPDLGGQEDESDEQIGSVAHQCNLPPAGASGSLLQFSEMNFR